MTQPRRRNGLIVVPGSPFHELIERRVQSINQGTMRGAHYMWLQDHPDGEYTDSDVPAMLEKLTQVQVTFVYGRIWGWPAWELCDRMGVTRSLGEKWEEAPWFPAAAERERRKAFLGDKRDAFLPLAVAVMKRLEHELTGAAGDKLAHDTAVYLADQLFGKPTTHAVATLDASPHGAEMVAMLLEAETVTREHAQDLRARVVDAAARVLPEPDDAAAG